VTPPAKQQYKASSSGNAQRITVTIDTSCFSSSNQLMHHSMINLHLKSIVKWNEHNEMTMK